MLFGAIKIKGATKNIEKILNYELSCYLSEGKSYLPRESKLKNGKIDLIIANKEITLYDRCNYLTLIFYSPKEEIQFISVNHLLADLCKKYNVEIKVQMIDDNRSEMVEYKIKSKTGDIYLDLEYDCPFSFIKNILEIEIGYSCKLIPTF